jgi:LacI family transcriptional regulator
MAAIGSIRALHDAQLRVPQDVSVVGFDDIKEAAYQTPSLTTIRQPLHHMGELAVQILLGRLRSNAATAPPEIAVEPELIIRESTGPARKRTGKGSSVRLTR